MTRCAGCEATDCAISDVFNLLRERLQAHEDANGLTPEEEMLILRELLCGAATYLRRAGGDADEFVVFAELAWGAMLAATDVPLADGVRHAAIPGTP